MSRQSIRSVLIAVLAALGLGVVGTSPVAAQEGQPAVEEADTRSTDQAAPNTVTAYGGAVDHGPASSLTLASSFQAIAPSPSGAGYWTAAADGGVFSFGDARFEGSMGGVALNQPVVGMAAHPSGNGYWLVAADGGIFSFGDAEFFGSTGAENLNEDITGIAADPAAQGYWLTSVAGEVFGFGIIERGSAAEADPEGTQARTVGIAADPQGEGYWLAHGARPILEAQDSGPDVESLQARLQSLGYWVGPVDGVYGKLTEQAVYAFQKYAGLSVDGVAGANTRAALSAAERPVARTGEGEVIEIDKARQLLFFVENGTVRWVFNTSTGTEEPYTYEGRQYLADTPLGRWEIYRQVDGVRVSNLGRLIRPKYFHTDGIAIHGYTNVPPYPASHGCVRVTLPAIDCIWANDLAPIGADVWVYGEAPR